MDAPVQSLLTDLEAKHGIEILYACESPSREDANEVLLEVRDAFGIPT